MPIDIIDSLVKALEEQLSKDKKANRTTRNSVFKKAKQPGQYVSQPMGKLVLSVSSFRCQFQEQKDRFWLVRCSGKLLRCLLSLSPPLLAQSFFSFLSIKGKKLLITYKLKVILYLLFAALSTGEELSIDGQLTIQLESKAVDDLPWTKRTGWVDTSSIESQNGVPRRQAESPLPITQAPSERKRLVTQAFPISLGKLVEQCNLGLMKVYLLTNGKLALPNRLIRATGRWKDAWRISPVDDAGSMSSELDSISPPKCIHVKFMNFMDFESIVRKHSLADYQLFAGRTGKSLPFGKGFVLDRAVNPEERALCSERFPRSNSSVDRYSSAIALSLVLHREASFLGWNDLYYWVFEIEALVQLSRQQLLFSHPKDMVFHFHCRKVKAKARGTKRRKQEQAALGEEDLRLRGNSSFTRNISSYSPTTRLNGIPRLPQSRRPLFPLEIYSRTYSLARDIRINSPTPTSFYAMPLSLEPDPDFRRLLLFILARSNDGWTRILIEDFVIKGANGNAGLVVLFKRKEPLYRFFRSFLGVGNCPIWYSQEVDKVRGMSQSSILPLKCKCCGGQAGKRAGIPLFSEDKIALEFGFQVGSGIRNMEHFRKCLLKWHRYRFHIRSWNTRDRAEAGAGTEILFSSTSPFALGKGSLPEGRDSTD
ncbi:voltage-dependent L-type calcium channel subunit alpha-1F [Striga asiatica]|uniref:Voltage-dependent L-type calcium channel subunit alpha-1F n=1 Tax=Striga asiatica TaxID=4170 RepID=A0A5A7PZF6_STRAF|nr:voltage-dependent L-type calcium channel subunit alpha-1F [Striga asiatica]